MHECNDDINHEQLPDIEDLSEALEAEVPQGSGEVQQPLRRRDMDDECDVLDEVVPSFARHEIYTLQDHDHEDEKGLPSIDGIQKVVVKSENSIL